MYPILPTLPFSLKNGVKKTPNFGTVMQKNAAGMGSAATSLKPYATLDFEVDLNYIEGSEADAGSVLAAFVGTYIQCGGRANLFLMQDPNDYSVTNMAFAVGDGTSTIFQLTRSIGVGIDVIQNVVGIPKIYINGTLTSAFTMDSTGVVTFSSAPGVDAILSWSGSFCYLCRFVDDSLASLTRVAFNRAGQEFWTIDGIKFSSEFVAPVTPGAVVTGVIYETVFGGTF